MPRFPTHLVFINFFSLLVFVSLPNTFVASIEPETDLSFPTSWVEKCGDEQGNIPLFKEQAKVFEICYTKLFNLSQLGQEFGISLQNKNITSFTRYHCSKAPQLYACLDEFANSVEHCFDENEQMNMKITVRAMSALVRFVCYREGERVAIFVKDEGMQCVAEEQQQAIQDCVANTTKEDFANVTTPDDLGFLVAFSYSPTTCRNVDEFYQCILKAIKQCSNRTPSLLFEALAKAVLKETPCWEKTNDSICLNIPKYLLTFLIGFMVL